MRKLMLRRKKITDPAKLISLMSRNLDKEIEIVKFYEDNLHLFKDKQNRKRIKELVLASLNHAAMFVESIHRLQEEVKPKKIKVPSMLARKNAIFTLENAMKEEKGAGELYLYEAKRIKDQKTIKTLLEVANEEIEHQRIVKSIARDIAKGLPDMEGKRILKKLNFI
jgi:rubrerythrin